MLLANLIRQRAVHPLERMNSPLEIAKSACADSAARPHAAFQAPARPQREITGLDSQSA